ncbi:MAG: hypothetical protein M0P09_02235 [Acholeplasmataceae bacterium]|nr:hypothetical protein [Acholeplasmataceae bacterium]
MLTFHCHPIVEKMLSEIAELLSPYPSKRDIHFITTYFPQLNSMPLGGLKEAVYHRLVSHNDYIVLLSFHDVESIRRHDTYKILDLNGTYFLRLPFNLNEIQLIYNKCSVPLGKTEPEWQFFATETCKSMLKEEISKLKHSGKLAIGNTIIYPLRAACIAHEHNTSAYHILINELLQKLKLFLIKEELSNLLLLADVAKALDDVFLNKVTASISILQDIAGDSGKREISIPELIKKTNNFIRIFDHLFVT